MQCHGDSALNRIVNIFDVIGCKDHDPSIVLKCTQKHRHESVMWVDERAWLHKHVGFIEEEGPSLKRAGWMELPSGSHPLDPLDPLDPLGTWRTL